MAEADASDFPIPRVQFEQICAAYFRVAAFFDRREDGAAPEDWKLVWLFDDLVTHNPERMWPALVELVDRAPDYAEEFIATGVIESLLILRKKQFVQALAAHANPGPKFMDLLNGPHWDDRDLARAIKTRP